jgi:hypothetical protein
MNEMLYPVLFSYLSCFVLVLIQTIHHLLGSKNLYYQKVTELSKTCSHNDPNIEIVLVPAFELPINMIIVPNATTTMLGINEDMLLRSDGRFRM